MILYQGRKANRLQNVADVDEALDAVQDLHPGARVQAGVDGGIYASIPTTAGTRVVVYRLLPGTMPVQPAVEDNVWFAEVRRIREAQARRDVA